MVLVVLVVVHRTRFVYDFDEAINGFDLITASMTRARAINYKSSLIVVQSKFRINSLEWKI